jgi:hypothetical protein
VVATSSSESEYIAYSLVPKEAVWLRRLLLELDYNGEDVYKVTILGDNQPAIALTLNPIHNFCSEHIDVRFHYAREQAKSGIVLLKYIPTLDMVADGLTKPLLRVNFRRFFEMLGLSATPEVILKELQSNADIPRARGCVVEKSVVSTASALGKFSTQAAAICDQPAALSSSNYTV